MIRLRVKEVAESVGVVDAAELSRRAGIAYDTAYRLWRGEVGGARRGDRSIGIVTLYRVAKALGVHTGDLYIEEDRLARLLAGHEPNTNSRAETEAAGMVAAVPALHP
jgi:transcriptional regulator with XRE-family HTH domain